MTQTISFTRLYLADDEEGARSEARMWGKSGAIITRVEDITEKLLKKHSARMSDDGDAESGMHLHLDPIGPMLEMLVQQVVFGTRCWAVTQHVSFATLTDFQRITGGQIA